MNNQEKEQQRLKNVLQFLFNENESVDESREYLISIGRNPDTMVKEGMEFIEKLTGKARFQIAREKMKSFSDHLENIQQSMTTNLQNFQAGAKAFLFEMFSSDELQTSFRKLDEITDEEALKIIEEKKLLDEFTKFKEQQK